MLFHSHFASLLFPVVSKKYDSDDQQGLPHDKQYISPNPASIACLRGFCCF
jgi:hypothetical protein